MPASVIVVHDDPGTRELAVSTLCAAGLKAVGFDDPLAALDTIEADARVRVLVTRVDFGPGKLNGPALALMLQHKRRNIKAVFGHRISRALTVEPRKLTRIRRKI